MAGQIEAAPQNRMFHGAFRRAVDARKVARAEGRCWNTLTPRLRLTGFGPRARNEFTPTASRAARMEAPPMDLNYTPEDIAFRKQVRAWLEANLQRKEIRTLDDRLGWHRKLYEAGYLGMGWPKEYGGGGARPMEQGRVGDQLAPAKAPGPANWPGDG